MTGRIWHLAKVLQNYWYCIRFFRRFKVLLGARRGWKKILSGTDKILHFSVNIGHLFIIKRFLDLWIEYIGRLWYNTICKSQMGGLYTEQLFAKVHASLLTALLRSFLGLSGFGERYEGF